MTSSALTLTSVKQHRGVPVRVGVGEGRVVDDRYAWRIGRHREEGWQSVVTFDDVGHHHDHRRDRAVRDEPLLAIEQVAAVVCAVSDRCDAGGVRAGVGLGHRVGVMELPLEGWAQPPVDQLRAGRLPDVVGRWHVPADAVGVAAELLLDQQPLGRRPALTTVLRAVQAAGEPRIEGGLTDSLDVVVRQGTARSLGFLFKGDENVVDIVPGPFLQVTEGGRQVGPGRRGVGHWDPQSDMVGCRVLEREYPD